MNSEITQLRVGDENFLVTSMIDRCPKTMMLRELVRNAIEAALTAPRGKRRVEITGLEIDGVPKLTVRNTGRGMNAEELFRMCDIASSIRKENRLDQNFGMGAKVASLPSNRLGMRYRSCHKGRVCEVMIGQRDGIYGRLRRSAPGTTDLLDVLDVTADAHAEGRNLQHDWTEVVLLGNHAGQNTLRNPYDGEPHMVGYWIAEELFRKFYRLPGDVALILHGPANISGHEFRFRSLSENLATIYARHEAVPAGQGVSIHYIYDEPLGDDPNQTRAAVDVPLFVHGFAGVVHKDEIYDIRWHHAWLHEGPVYGIPFLGRNITVLVEFADDYPVLPDGYRQFLRMREGRQEQVQLRQFAQAIHSHRPAWLIELIQRNAPRSLVSEEVTAGLNRLLAELKVPRRARAVQARDTAASKGSGSGAAAGANAPASPKSEPVAGRSEPEFEPPPQIIMLRDLNEAEARGLTGRGARYYPETHQLFVNCLYPAVQAMRAILEREFAWVEDQSLIHQRVLEAAEQSLVARVGRMLIFGLSKHGSWEDWEVNHAMSTQSLTLAADDYHQSLPEARAALRVVLRNEVYENRGLGPATAKARPGGFRAEP